LLRGSFILLFYAPLSKLFSLSHILSPSPQEKNRLTTYQHLVDFYNLQQPGLANSSDKTIRQAWNQVVADLNQDGDVIRVRYIKPYNNEISPGFINLIHVLT
jgi:hypothetical protein